VIYLRRSARDLQNKIQHKSVTRQNERRLEFHWAMATQQITARLLPP
jgi:hypothetical protein